MPISGPCFFFSGGQCQSIPWAMELWLCWSPETVESDGEVGNGGEVVSHSKKKHPRSGCLENNRCVWMIGVYIYWIEMLKLCFVLCLGKNNHETSACFFVLKIFHEYVDCPWTKKWSQVVFLGSWTFNYWFWSLLARQTPSLGGAQKSDERRKLPRKLQEHMERHALNKQGENRHPFPSFDPTIFLKKNLPS